MLANLESLQGLVYSERLARLLMKTMDRDSALSLVDDWCATAIAQGRHLKEVALAAQPGSGIEEAFSAAAFIAELAPVLEAELAAL